MRFTGKNLLLIRAGLDLAIDELHNQIATCPDVEKYTDDLDILEAEQEQYKKLALKIDAKLNASGERDEQP